KLLRSERVAVTTIEGVPEDSPWADPVWAPAGRPKVPAPRASRAAGHEAVMRCAIGCCESRWAGSAAPFYPVAPGIERGYDAITPRRLHRGAPSKIKQPGKGGYSTMLPAPFRPFISLISALVCTLIASAAQAQAP